VTSEVKFARHATRPARLHVYGIYIRVRAFRNDRAIVRESVRWLRDSCHVALNRVIADYDRAPVKNGMSTSLARPMRDRMGR